MSEWPSDELGRLAELRMGQSPPGSVVGELRDGLPFLQGNAEFGVRSPQPRYQCNEAPRRAEPGDVLISVRAPVGAINVADQACGIGRGLAGVRFSKLDQRFGLRALQETAIMLDRVSQGTTFAAISRTELASLRLPVPPLEEQRRIAEVLDTIDETIQATERVIAKAELIEQGLKRALVGNKSAAADGWKQVTIGDLGTVVTGTTPSTADERYWHGPVPFITPGDINARGDVCNTDRRVTGLGADLGKRIPPGSVVVVCIGSIGKVGRVYESAVTNQQINTIIPSPEYDSEFVACLLELARPSLEAEAGRQVVPIVNASVLRSLAVYVCPLGSQRDIVAPLHLLRDRINRERSLLTKLQQFRSGLAADLLSGCVRTVAV